MSKSKKFGKNYFLVQREKVLIRWAIIFQKMFKNFNVESAKLNANSKQNLIFRHRARWKKNPIISHSGWGNSFAIFFFLVFFWSVLALNVEVDDFIFFHSIGFFVGPISTRAWGYPELFSFGPIINSVKHQMDNLEEKFRSLFESHLAKKMFLIFFSRRVVIY